MECQKFLSIFDNKGELSHKKQNVYDKFQDISKSLKKIVDWKLRDLGKQKKWSLHFDCLFSEQWDFLIKKILWFKSQAE